ncbi:hypothetical protein DL93DRAFT_95420 [Clavulina sp. PMI_390]|nr:hypothetical protein DL93DRAFT_95420 [Clavulina sp. PMI_390]
MLRNRHNVIKQSVLRNENFSPPISGRERTNYLKISTTKNLLGRAGERFMLFGVLTHTQDGKLCLRDLEGMVVLDISHTTPSEGFFTDGCFVLVEGDYTDEETLNVIVIGHPPCERRSSAKSVFGHIDFLGKGATTLLEEEKYQERLAEFEPSPNFLVLSDLWLDHPRTLDGLRRVLDGCVEHDFIPFAFIFCGNFSTRKVDVNTTEGQAQYGDLFEALAELLLSYEPIISASHFLFVPGPLDPWGTPMLPRPPLPPPFTSRFRSKMPPNRAHFVANPCRIKFFGQEIVVMRSELMEKMMASLVGVKPDLEGAMDTKRYLVQTIVDQCHLSPLPISVQPINWALDHTLRLYPMPTTLILADSYERFELTYEGCHVFNPGNFVGNEFGFSTYFPNTGRSEASSIERVDEDD